MRQSIRLALGATLLEVMLVLSIIALIILMSVKFYQASSNASQTEQVLGTIQAITGAADNLSSGSSNGYSNATSANIASIAGSGTLVSPWGGSIKITSGGPTSYSVSIPGAPGSVCTQVVLKLKSNSKITAGACQSPGFSYTFNATS